MSDTERGEFGGAAIAGEERLLAGLRLALGLATLLIVWIDPSNPERFVAVTYAVLILYAAFSVSLYGLAAIRRVGSMVWAQWADVAWFALLVGISNGADSIFFFGFFFPVAASSFLFGVRSGLRVALVSAAVFSIVALNVAPAVAGVFPWNRLLLRCTYLLLLGFMIGHWGEREIQSKRRLAFLGGLACLANPRLGLDAVLGRVQRQVRRFFGARECLLAYALQEGGPTRIRRDRAGSPHEEIDTESLAPPTLAWLFGLPATLAVVRNRRAGLGSRRFWAWDVQTGQPDRRGQAESAEMANLLEADNILTAPIRLGSGFLGRLFLVRDRRPFQDSEGEFLVHLIRQLTPALDHLQLVDRLAGSAAEEQRLQIARDIHDSVVQPYVGLRMGLRAVREVAEQDASDRTRDALDRLVAIADDAIAELRGYVSKLRDPKRRHENLEMALHRFAEKLSELTDIRVRVECRGEEEISDRMAGEVFQMAVEGLNNVRKHTDSSEAGVLVVRTAEALRLEVSNPNSGDHFQVFRPLTIGERAAALGGAVQVFQDAGRQTVVRIDIPLWE